MFVSIHRCAVLPFDSWFARDDVGVLTCIPLNRFHATAQYQWLRNDCEMEDNTYMQFSTPQAVANTSAEWVDEDIYDGGIFSVTGMLNNIRSCWYNVLVALYYWNCNWYLSQTSCIPTANEKIYYLVKKLHANCICGKIHCVANNVIWQSVLEHYQWSLLSEYSALL